MAKYEKNIEIAGTSVKIIFHGVSREVLENKTYGENYKIFDEYTIRAFFNEYDNSGIVTPIDNSELEYLRVAFGDVLRVRENPQGNPGFDIVWDYSKTLYMTNFAQFNFNDLPSNFEPLSGSYASNPIITPFRNSFTRFTSYEGPLTIHIRNVLYFNDEQSYNDFKRRWQQDHVIEWELIQNLGGDDEQEDYETSKQYWFYNSVTTYLKDPSGRYTIKQGTTYRKVTFDATDKRLYFTSTEASNGNYTLKNYSGVSCEYSNDNGKTWTNVDSMPSNYANIVKGNLKVGGAVLVGSFSTNIPIFGDNEKGEEYEQGFIEADEADNVDTLSKDDYSPVTPVIKSGLTETTTTLGSGVAMDKMTMFYKLTAGQLATFGATLFNAENADAVTAGTKLVGSDALNSIVGLRYYPFDISKVATVSGTYYIKLGSWDSGCASSGVITQNNGVIDMGDTVIKPMFNNFLDYTNVSMAIYLPYIGVREVDIKNVLGKTLKVQYIVDITTGKCNAMLYSNGLLFDSHEGTIARDCPVSGTDAQSYNTANRQASLAMTNTKISGVQSITSIMGAGLKDGLSGNVGGVVGDVGKAAAFSKTYGSVYDQAVQDVVNARNNLPTYFNGSSGGQLGEIAPQYVYLIFAVNKTHIPANELEIIGRPSNNSGTVSQFYGFLSCDMVKMETMATTTEKEMINTMLSGGIYI